MIKGILYLASSAFSFALATVFVKLVTSSTDIPSIEISFFRFLFGFLVTLFYILHKKKTIKPVKSIHVYMRGIFNTIAVILFFIGVEYSNISRANLLNMTYPVFVFLLAPFLNNEKSSKQYFIYLLMTGAGVYFTMVPEGVNLNRELLNRGDIIALLSGIVTGFAITSLREAKKYNHSYMIVFYVMLIGTIVNGIMIIPYFVKPHGIFILYIFLCALTSYIGQYCITEGYKYIDAAPGSLVSATRIIFAIALGNILFSEPLTPRIILGSLLVLISIAGIGGFFTYINGQMTTKKMDA